MTAGGKPGEKGICSRHSPLTKAFQELTMEEIATSELRDAAWAQYEIDRDKEVLNAKHAFFFRSIFVPSLASAPNAVRAGDVAAFVTFADQLEERLKKRLARRPVPICSYVQSMLWPSSAEEPRSASQAVNAAQLAKYLASMGN
jgi:hypothetical protein